MEFVITSEKNCPLYKAGEGLRLTERTFAGPPGKEVCLILARDMTELLFRIRGQEEKEEGSIFNCSGCTGLIKFRLLSQSELEQRSIPSVQAAVSADGKRSGFPAPIASPFFGLLSESEKTTLLSHVQQVQLVPGAVLIRKGEQNVNLYIVASGTLVVKDGQMFLARLGKGDFCGEMSYLGADTAVSSVIAETAALVLAVGGETFGALLGNNPAVQNYMAKLLASRLRRTNEARAGDFEACMSGRLEEIVPAELLQVFHMHQKTGILTMEFPAGLAKIAFREGCIINASFGDKQNEDAIFAVLSEKSGVYRFTTGLSPREMKAAEIGDFMMLLMEGVKRVDEEAGHDE